MFELQLLLGLKIAFLIILAGYSVFAFIIINQIKVMTRVIKKQSSGFLLTLAFVNLIFGVSLFMLALVIL